VPTLVIDRRGYATARYIADHIEGSTFQELRSDDSIVFCGQAAELLDAIEEFLTGKLPTHDADRALATVVFTGMVASTETATQMGDRRWRALLDAHDSMVRHQLERFRGREVKATGDGFLATFDGPARAIQCGWAIRDAAQQLGVEVRVGVHTGEVELRGGDIGGITVHIGQRVSSLAHPGEVLASRTVADLLAGSSITFSDRGEHELKGLPGAWRMFAVEA